MQGLGLPVFADRLGAHPADEAGRVQPGAPHLLPGAAPVLAREAGGGVQAQGAAEAAGQLALLYRGGRQAKVSTSKRGP